MRNNKHSFLLLSCWFILKKIIKIFGKNYSERIKLNILNFLINFGISSSQNRIDKKILNLFKYKKNGFFVEVGAYDGINYSNSFLLEKKYNWKGLLVEPLKTRFEICKKFRSKSIVLNHILSNQKDMNKFIKFYDSGIESLVVDHNVSLMPDDHLKDKLLKNYNYVQAVTLDYLLEVYNINKIDILIVDVEGFEINLLDGFLKDYKASYILIETFDEQKLMKYSMERHWKLVDKFTDNDYLFKVIKDSIQKQ